MEKRAAKLLVRGDSIVDLRSPLRGPLCEDAIAWKTPDDLHLVDLRVGPYVVQWGADTEIEIEPKP